MRLLKTGIAALALAAFAIAPASACSWHKTAKAKEKMSVAETTVIPDADGDVSIATNDLRDGILKKRPILPAGEKPAE